MLILFSLLDLHTMQKKRLFVIVSPQLQVLVRVFHFFASFINVFFIISQFFVERFDFIRNLSEYLLGSKSPTPLIYEIFFKVGGGGGISMKHRYIPTLDIRCQHFDN